MKGTRKGPNPRRQAPPATAESELIGVSEVAALAGVTRAAVTNWRARGTDRFPPPAAEARSGPLYRQADIEFWLAARNTIGESTPLQPLGIEATLWATADKLRGSVDPSQYRHIVLGL